eukprot:g290.t1
MTRKRKASSVKKTTSSSTVSKDIDEPLIEKDSDESEEEVILGEDDDEVLETDDEDDWSSDEEDEESSEFKGSKGSNVDSRQLNQSRSTPEDLFAQTNLYHGLNVRDPANRSAVLRAMEKDGSLDRAKLLHADDLESDDEENDPTARNTIGNVPLEWYDEFDHIGYDVAGQKIKKTGQPGAGDSLDRYLRAKDDPNYRRTIWDPKNNREIVLSDRQLLLVKRIMKGKAAHPEHNDTPDMVFWATGKVNPYKFSDDYQSKQAFIPSKWERQHIVKYVKAIKEGRMVVKSKEEKEKQMRGEKEPALEPIKLLWGEDGQLINERTDESDLDPEMLNPFSSGLSKKRQLARIIAPKLALPGHAMSYRPPGEYLLDEDEKKKWEAEDESDRPYDVMPQEFNNMRTIPGYQEFIHERFSRCLDLYLSTRARKQRLRVDPESLIPNLPDPSALRPFPTRISVRYRHNISQGKVRSLSVSPCGQWLCSGGEDGILRIWEVSTGRCFRRWDMRMLKDKFPKTYAMEKLQILGNAWNPKEARNIIAVTAGNSILLLPPGTANRSQSVSTKAFFEAGIKLRLQKGNVMAEDDKDRTKQNEETVEDHDNEETTEDGSSGEKQKESKKEKGLAYKVEWCSPTDQDCAVLEDEDDAENEGDSDTDDFDEIEDAPLVLTPLEYSLMIRSRQKETVFTKLLWHRKGDYLASLHITSGE